MTFFTPSPDGPHPDPELQPEFYADVPAKRLVAWVVDTVLTVAATALIVLLTAFVGLFFLPLLYLSVAFAYRTVTIARKGRQQTFRIVGVDEADAAKGWISFRSPMAQAILGARLGDVIEANEPLGEIYVEKIT